MPLFQYQQRPGVPFAPTGTVFLRERWELPLAARPIQDTPTAFVALSSSAPTGWQSTVNETPARQRAPLDVSASFLVSPSALATGWLRASADAPTQCAPQATPATFIAPPSLLLAGWLQPLSDPPPPRRRVPIEVSKSFTITQSGGNPFGWYARWPDSGVKPSGNANLETTTTFTFEVSEEIIPPKPGGGGDAPRRKGKRTALADRPPLRHHDRKITITDEDGRTRKVSLIRRFEPPPPFQYPPAWAVPQAIHSASIEAQRPMPPPAAFPAPALPASLLGLHELRDEDDLVAIGLALTTPDPMIEDMIVLLAALAESGALDRMMET